jgi:hypothetical protein
MKEVISREYQPVPDPPLTAGMVADELAKLVPLSVEIKVLTPRREPGTACPGTLDPVAVRQ